MKYNTWHNVTIFPVKLDQSVIAAFAAGDQSARNKSLVKQWCQTKKGVCTWRFFQFPIA